MELEQGRVLESPELLVPRARVRPSRACPEGTSAEPLGVEEEAAVEQGGFRDSPPPLTTEAGMAALLHVKFRAFPRLKHTADGVGDDTWLGLG